MITVDILGCGNAGGTPMICAGWGKCNPMDPKNKRWRTSASISDGTTCLLLDTSPDLRMQLLESGIRQVDAVLYTHDHADHIHGLDDLREINRITRKPIDIYGNNETLKTLQQRFSYAFEGLDFEKDSVYKPYLIAHEIQQEQTIGSLKVQAIELDHGLCGCVGYRVGNVAYCTDVVQMTKENLAALQGLDLFVVGCLTMNEHPTHAHLARVEEWVGAIKPKKTVLTHMGLSMDYGQLKEILPEHIEPAYDGMSLSA